jgi:hypothetical protein
VRAQALDASRLRSISTTAAMALIPSCKKSIYLPGTKKIVDVFAIGMMSLIKNIFEEQFLRSTMVRIGMAHFPTSQAAHHHMFRW